MSKYFSYSYLRRFCCTRNQQEQNASVFFFVTLGMTLALLCLVQKGFSVSPSYMIQYHLIKNL